MRSPKLAIRLSDDGVMTLFDGIAGSILLISALFGLARGATREVTTLLALVLSLFIAAFAARFGAPLLAPMIHIAWMAYAVAMLFLFVISYVILRTLGGLLTSGVRNAGLSGLDRILGLGVGLGRGLLVIGLMGLLIAAAVPAERVPAWISRAKLYPLAESAGAVLRAAAPRGAKMTHELAPLLADSGRDPDPRGERHGHSLAVVVEPTQ
jgi:membrane protein required for colicin V production